MMYIDGSQGSQTPVQDDHRRKCPLKEQRRNRYYVKDRNICTSIYRQIAALVIRVINKLE